MCDIILNLPVNFVISTSASEEKSLKRENIIELPV